MTVVRVQVEFVDERHHGDRSLQRMQQGPGVDDLTKRTAPMQFDRELPITAARGVTQPGDQSTRLPDPQRHNQLAPKLDEPLGLQDQHSLGIQPDAPCLEVEVEPFGQGPGVQIAERK